jgi:electron transport complex protein RnfG
VNKNNKIWTHLAPIVVLTGICIVITAALAVTNYFTAPIIAANQQSTADGAKQVVLPSGADFEPVPEADLPVGITAADKAGNGAGYVFTLNVRGYAEFTAMVGVDSDGKIAGTQVLTHAETDGIGTKVVENGSDFQKKLVGISDPGAIEAVSGATMSSNGMKAAVQTSLDAYTVLTGGKVEAKLATRPENLTDEHLEQYFPGATFTEVPGGMVSDAGTVVYGETQGMESMVRVAVFFDNDSNILGILAYTKRETEYLGDQVGDDSSFTERFKGVTDVDAVDVVAGATVTSEAVKASVKQAITNLDTVKGAA